MPTPIILTKEGFSRLREQIASREEELRRVLEGKGEAIAMGGSGWHDNFLFEDLSVKSNQLAQEIAKLRRMLQEAQVIEPVASGDTVTIGSRVLVEFADGSTTRLTITDPILADPASGFVSYECPMAKALLGSKEGEVREWVTSARKMQLVIRGIS